MTIEYSHGGLVTVQHTVLYRASRPSSGTSPCCRTLVKTRSTLSSRLQISSLHDGLFEVDVDQIVDDLAPLLYLELAGERAVGSTRRGRDVDRGLGRDLARGLAGGARGTGGLGLERVRGNTETCSSTEITLTFPF